MLPDYTKSVRFNMCPISLIDNTVKSAIIPLRGQDSVCDRHYS
jgi:hypothetical protein